MNPADKQPIERQNIAVEYADGVLDEIRAHVAGNFDRDLESGGGITQIFQPLADTLLPNMKYLGAVGR